MDIIGLTFVLIPGSIALAFLVAAMAVYQRFAAEKLLHEGYGIASGGDFLRYSILLLGEVASVIFVIQIIFTGIERLFPDRLAFNSYGGDYASTIRFAISSLLIVYPIMILVEWWIRKVQVKGHHETLAHKGYLWVGLVVTAFMLVATAIATLNEFLSGEITSRFLAKALVLALIAILIGGFRLVRILQPKAKKVFTMMYAISGVLVLASIMWGFVIIGSPAKARMLRFDRERVEHLSNIQQRIFEYWQTRGELPEGLDVLSSRGPIPVDPVSGSEYQYHVAMVKQAPGAGIVHFKLCATFSLPSEKSHIGPGMSTLPLIQQTSYDWPAWEHQPGEVCFERSIDPKDFPDTMKTLRAMPIDVVN